VKIPQSDNNETRLFGVNNYFFKMHFRRRETQVTFEKKNQLNKLYLLYGGVNKRTKKTEFQKYLIIQNFHSVIVAM
jgi:hypothetical protein